MTDKIEVRATWVSYHTIEIEDEDFDPDATYDTLNDFPDYALEEITSDVASLHDWEVN